MTPAYESGRRARLKACWRSALLGALVLAWPGTPDAAAKSADAGLQPYKARYQVQYRGLSGGQIESSLSRGSVAGQWLYETRAYPSMLGRVAVSPNARERGVMQVTAEGVRPLSFHFNDGSENSRKDVRFTFDWAAGRVRGEAQGTPFDLAVRDGTQDTASVQAAMILALATGREPEGFPILTGAKLREYRYWPEGQARVVTPYGQFDTVVWVNQRSGSTRLTKVWHAPALGYLPVQAVQYRKGQAETQMKLVALERSGSD
jgi:hypothetical protein